jgi:hypothetical protein
MERHLGPRRTKAFPDKSFSLDSFTIKRPNVQAIVNKQEKASHGQAP